MVSPSARLARIVRRVTRVPTMMASPPQISGLRVMCALKFTQSYSVPLGLPLA